MGRSHAYARIIGSVCEELREQFPDVSVSKIRYLEDQGLISPRRTRGGYRLFAPDDIERLTTILKLQRDEFLPLRVIREELDGPGAWGERARRRSVGVLGHEDEIDDAELCERVLPWRRTSFASSRSSDCSSRGSSPASATSARVRPSYRPQSVPGSSRFGVDARHLADLLTAAGRQAALVEQLVAPGLRSRNPERRKGALDDVEALSRIAQELSHLLFVRDVRATIERSS